MRVLEVQWSRALSLVCEVAPQQGHGEDQWMRVGIDLQGTRVFNAVSVLIDIIQPSFQFLINTN